jgi:hypothetical protein
MTGLFFGISREQRVCLQAKEKADLQKLVRNRKRSSWSD